MDKAESQMKKSDFIRELSGIRDPLRVVDWRGDVERSGTWER